VEKDGQVNEAVQKGLPKIGMDNLLSNQILKERLFNLPALRHSPPDVLLLVKTL